MTQAWGETARSDSTRGGVPDIYSARAFLQAFKPIESIVDGLPMPRGGLVSITGPTGHGKTTLVAALQIALTSDGEFAGREVTSGQVLALVGENPDDYAMHLLATLQDAGAEPNARLLVMPGTFDILNHIDMIEQFVGTASPAGDASLVAVFVDTSAAYNTADDENDNLAMRRHASMLRELTTLPGNPCVFVLCHPTKSAQRDNLIPRGGGAFLAEVDANLTVWKDDSGIVSLHWAGKIRGVNFDPVKFEITPVSLDGRTDSRGKPIHSTAVRHVPDERADQIQARDLNDEDRLLIALRREPGSSVADLARECGWLGDGGRPNKTKADRRLKSLHSHGLAEQDRKGKWRLTTKGLREAEALPC